MDIIDIMLARALTPQGQTDLYVSKANKAAAKAAQAEADAQAAIDTVTNAAEDIADAQAAAATLLETAESITATLDEAASSQAILDEKADKTDTVLNTTLSRGRKENTTVGEGSFAFGNNVEARGNYSHAEGGGTTASGYSSHAEGQSSTASGNYSHAEGSGGTIASGVGAHAEGSVTTASGMNSHTEGSGTQASGGNAHAEGISTQATAYGAHAEGISSLASGTSSHVEGVSTSATAMATHSEGQLSIASGQVSHAEGYGTIANHAYQHAGGQYNIADPAATDYTLRGNYVEIIGNGTADNARSNARTLDWQGNERLAGDLTIFAGTNNETSISDLKTAIANLPSGGGNATIHFTTDDAGHILVVDENGNVIASNVTEDSIIESLISSGSYVAKAAVGIDIDYANKTFTRTQQAVNLNMGEDFNQFLMYGGRVKCNVSDDGTINAFYGDPTYREDGSNGQVMIYQPKFYYKRTPYSLENTSKGKIIRHESLILSNINQAGFKLAPIFEGDLDYILLPAYDGSLDANNKLASVAGATPLSSITITEAEDYAKARGTGWHIVNFAAESANQMLEIVEFGMMNGQVAIEQGITSNPSNGNPCYFITGSTASLGNGTGAAESTQVVINGNTSTQTTVGYRAITYRGMENPWGNFWQMIAGVNIYGNGSQGGGTPYICTDYNYTPGVIGENYEDVGFNLPYEYKWINAMGYGNAKYDWVFLPIECAGSANSLLPVGDSIWSVRGLKDTNILASGGSYGYGEECGPFYYAVDRNAAASSRVNYGAKLMFIPTKNSIYTANITKWSNHIGG